MHAVGVRYLTKKVSAVWNWVFPESSLRYPFSKSTALPKANACSPWTSCNKGIEIREVSNFKSCNPYG